MRRYIRGMYDSRQQHNLFHAAKRAPTPRTSRFATKVTKHMGFMLSDSLGVDVFSLKRASTSFTASRASPLHARVWMCEGILLYFFACCRGETSQTHLHDILLGMGSEKNRPCLAHHGEF